MGKVQLVKYPIKGAYQRSRPAMISMSVAAQVSAGYCAAVSLEHATPSECGAAAALHRSVKVDGAPTFSVDGLVLNFPLYF